MKEKAPFTILNALGIPLIVQHSANLRPVGAEQHGKLHELPAQRSMDLEHSVLEPSSRGKLSALQRQESCLFHLTIGQNGFFAILMMMMMMIVRLRTPLAGVAELFLEDKFCISSVRASAAVED